MKRNARRLLALVTGLALLVSLFAVAEDGGQEAVDLGVDIVIDAGTGTADGIVTDGGIIVENEAGELEIEPEGVATPRGRRGSGPGPGPERHRPGEQRGTTGSGDRQSCVGRGIVGGLVQQQISSR